MTTSMTTPPCSREADRDRTDPVASPTPIPPRTGRLLHQLPGVEPAPAVPDSTRSWTPSPRRRGGLDELPEAVVIHDLITPMPPWNWSATSRSASRRWRGAADRRPQPAVLAAAMDSGARGVVGLPLTYADLGARVEAAASWAAGVRAHLNPQRALPSSPAARCSPWPDPRAA